jgi:hypothetical protein
MSGPIVRSGPSPGFTKNWDSVFGGKKKAASKPVTAASAAPAKKKPAESKKTKSKGKSKNRGK